MISRLLPSWILAITKNPKSALPDINAGLMMAVLAIPQSLGYAALAGLPPVMGLYAAILPTIVYAYIGASSVNAVGPVAISAIMTASSLGAYAAGSTQYIAMAITLALMVGVLLWLASLLKLGWIMQFVSRGVSSGFISGAAVLIIIGQLKYLIGTPISGDGIIAIARNLATSQTFFHPPTAMLGLTILLLFIINKYLPTVFWGLFHQKYRPILARIFVVAVVILSIILSNQHQWQNAGIRTLLALPNTPPTPRLPALSPSVLIELFPAALTIALIAFISSSAIASNYARLRQEPFDNNQELKGLGFANIASAIFGGFAVASGLSRTSLNVSLGANSPLSSVACGLGILVIMLCFGQYLIGLPYAVLSAIIISSVLSMVDFATFKNTLKFDRMESLSFITTFLVAVFLGLNHGLIAGLLMSFAGIIYRSHHVHIAVVGQVGSGGHFRNVLRHQVRTFSDILLIRIDESLYFGNAQSVRNRLDEICSQYTARQVVIIMGAVNHVDLSAVEMLLDFNTALKTQNKTLHFAEIKGPVMDILKHTPLIKRLDGQIFLSTEQAIKTLNELDDWVI